MRSTTDDIRLILGSASPRRAELLRTIGTAFEIRAADVDETYDETASPEEYVEAISKRKAEAVSKLPESVNFAIGGCGRQIVIGADTIVVSRRGTILGKPTDDTDARRMLGELSGAWHEVYTGITLLELNNARDNRGIACAGLSENTSVSHHERTRVKMCDIGAADIDYYIDTREPYGKAGAYAIQGAGSLFIERVEGCYFNIVGLPLKLLRTMLRSFGYDLLTKKRMG
jgi:septum formation protein